MTANGAGTVPEFRHAGDVHPFVKELEVGHGSGVAFCGGGGAGSAAGY